jgi:hypothetical protein
MSINAVQRTRPLLRFGVILNVLGWGLAAEGGRCCDTKSQVVLLNVIRCDDSALRSCPLSPRGGGVTGNGGVSSTQQASKNRVAQWIDCGEGWGRGP